ncbi:MAG TPA: P-II family nitrogen regulator [Myxococcota bacterium]|nr:P-II family nitrogen regulator [Myxococcota bacterium]
MKRIEALIKPHQLEELKAALYGRGLLPGVTASELRGYTRGVSERAIYRGAEQTIDLFPRIKIEIIAHDELVAPLARAIGRAIGTDRGDCEILVSEVAAVVRIRTGEIDEAAIA